MMALTSTAGAAVRWTKGLFQGDRNVAEEEKSCHWIVSQRDRLQGAASLKHFCFPAGPDITPQAMRTAFEPQRKLTGGKGGIGHRRGESSQSLTIHPGF